MSNYTQASLGHLAPQHLMLKAVNWLIYLTRVSQLCPRLNLLMPKELYKPTFFKH